MVVAREAAGRGQSQGPAVAGGGRGSGRHDRETAEKTAFEMWEHALQENATRQLRRESTEKIERLKAQFLDKVRHFTELVETANAKIEAEAKARAEAEAKLAQMARTAEAKTEDRGQRAEDRERPAISKVAPGVCEARVRPARRPFLRDPPSPGRSPWPGRPLRRETSRNRSRPPSPMSSLRTSFRRHRWRPASANAAAPPESRRPALRVSIPASPFVLAA